MTKFILLENDVTTNINPKFKELFLYSCNNDKTMSELAIIFNLPLGTVKSRLHRARAEVLLHRGKVKENDT